MACTLDECDAATQACVFTSLDARQEGRKGGRFTGKTYKYSITQLGRTVAAVALRLREEVVIAALSTGVP